MSSRREKEFRESQVPTRARRRCVRPHPIPVSRHLRVPGGCGSDGRASHPLTKANTSSLGPRVPLLLWAGAGRRFAARGTVGREPLPERDGAMRRGSHGGAGRGDAVLVARRSAATRPSPTPKAAFRAFTVETPKRRPRLRAGRYPTLPPC